MNCKQGDLAVIVKSWAGNEGKIVRCLKLIPNKLFLTPNSTLEGPAWVIDRQLTSFLGSQQNTILDSLLRPIRDQDGEDETLTWVPRKVEMGGEGMSDYEHVPMKVIHTVAIIGVEELESLRKDAKRYRWLRDTGAVFTARCAGDDGRGCHVADIGRPAEGLDAAIDAAMAGEGKAA